MKKYFSTKYGKLFNADCIDALRDMADDSVDMVMTDPPYSSRTHKMAKTNKGKGHGNKLISFNALPDDTFVNLCIECLRISRGWVVMTCDHRHAPLMFDHESFIRIGAWVKTNPMPQISADRPGQGHEAVLILHSGKTKKRWNRGGGAAVWRHNVCDKSLVPTQKPLNLIVSILGDFAEKGDIILDPFFGSGTTGLACEKLGLNWIGIEREETHCAVAKQRLSQSRQQSLLTAI